MVMKLFRTETDEHLKVSRTLYTRSYILILDKKRCIGCEICRAACPKEAIEIIKPTRVEGERLSHASISIDEKKCSFCGICSTICPVGALKLIIDGEEKSPVIEKGSFPELIRRVEIDTSKCPRNCIECQEACPFDLIKVKWNGNSVRIDVDLDHCPGCRLCEAKCPEDAITVKKIFSGRIRIDWSKCPDECRDCVDVCPIPGVLEVSDDGRVEVNDYFCIYCGACRVVCPVEDALLLERTVIAHAPVQSGAWNSALERLTSTRGLIKELVSKRMERALESVTRRLR